jgi:hypothetical protein
VDVGAQRLLGEFVRTTLQEELDEICRLAFQLEKVEEQLGLRKPPPKARRAAEKARERRRRQVARLARKGRSVTQIARELGVSRSTARADLEAVGVRPKGTVTGSNGSGGVRPKGNVTSSDIAGPSGKQPLGEGERPQAARNGSPPAARSAGGKYRPAEDIPGGSSEGWPDSAAILDVPWWRRARLVVGF